MKTQLKAKRDNIQFAITATRKELRQAEKAREWGTARRLESEIDRLQALKKMYEASVEPVQFSNGFVLNGKLLKQFVRKLPAIQLEADFIAGNQIIEIKHKNGKISLYDLREKYQGLKMPKGEDLLDELGISFG